MNHSKNSDPYNFKGYLSRMVDFGLVKYFACMQYLLLRFYHVLVLVDTTRRVNP